MPMNGVLPDVTWGTWDAYSWMRQDAQDTQTGRDSHEQPVAIAASAKSKNKLQRKGLHAPKASQLWFEEVLAKIDGASFGDENCVYHCNPLRCLHNHDHDHQHRHNTGPSMETTIPWEQLPQGIHPRDGKLPMERIRKKRHQVENLAVFLQRLLCPGDRVVEFCAGSGYVALPLACMFPQCTFVILDKKEPSLAIANERIQAAQLTNVEVFCGFIDDYDKRFDVGIALHACGEATDMVMQKCLTSQAAFVLAPCCVGKIKLSSLCYPRSQTLRGQLSRTEYEVLARAADFGHTNDAAAEMSHSQVNLKRRKCKSLLESDRNALARENGYETWMFVMHPHDATPKNDVLVGLPRSSATTSIITEGERTGSSITIETTTGTATERTLRLECVRKLDEKERERVIFGRP